jgi:hypothetical protein
MINRDELEAIREDLDKYIQDNLEISLGRGMLPSKQKKIIAENCMAYIDEETNEKESFLTVFENMLKKLKIVETKKTQEFCISALINKQHFSKLKNKMTKKPEKMAVIGLGLAIIDRNLKTVLQTGEFDAVDYKATKLKKSPMEIMKELFHTSEDKVYTFRCDKELDLVILFCLERHYCEIIDIDDITILCSTSPDILSWEILKDIKFEEQINMINSLVEQTLSECENKKEMKRIVEEKKEKYKSIFRINNLLDKLKKYFSKKDKKDKSEDKSFENFCNNKKRKMFNFLQEQPFSKDNNEKETNSLLKEIESEYEKKYGNQQCQE